MTEQDVERSPVPDTLGGEQGNGLYVDIHALLNGGVPDPPAPALLLTEGGYSLFYAGQVNLLFGDPESGKTLVALAAASEALIAGEKVLLIDIDHNGAQATVCRLIDMGVPEETLTDPDLFRYVEPDDKAHLLAVVADAQVWKPAAVVADSIGELLPLLRLSSNSPDDFTIAHARVLKPLALAGAAVIAIDHLPKNTENRANGPTGTAAKRRAIGGVSLRVSIKDQFAPGKSGSAVLSINKDRHGGLRRHCSAEGREPIAGVFHLSSTDTEITWSIKAAAKSDAVLVDGVSEADLTALDQLDPPPSSVRDVKDRMSWRSDRAASVLRTWRSRRSPGTDGEQGTGDGESVPRSPTPCVGNGERINQTDQNVVQFVQKDVFGGIWEGTPA